MSTANPEQRSGADPVAPESVAELIASNARWYHTIELAPGVTTPGWFDLRPVADQMQWPDVSGKRCLDVGPYDGFISFELERRGAAEVVAADVPDFASWDWPARLRRQGPTRLAAEGAEATGAGFEIAKRCLGSSVERIELSVYDLSPERLGHFDVVTCGSLLLHLRDPVRALEAIRSVCSGEFMSAEQIDAGLTLRRRRQPAALNMAGERCQWWVPNLAGYKAILIAAGFKLEAVGKPYAIPLGEGHRDRDAASLRRLRSRIAKRLLTGGRGVPHASVLATPDRSFETA